MELFLQLWLPILASAVAVWFASAIAWMGFKHHDGDTSPLPDEDALMNAVRSLEIPPGNYIFPRMVGKSCDTPEFKEKWEKGPTGMIWIWPKKVSMGSCMFLSLLVYLSVSVLIGYMGAMALPAGTSFLKVFQVLGTAGVLAYCFSCLPFGIWFQQNRRALVMMFVDGLVYGLITGAIFAAMWPKA